MRRLGRFILALLRELADESAYQRRFSEERQRARYAIARCC